MASRVARPNTAFAMSRGRTKRPREGAATHLDFIRTLPCLICGNPIETQAAHIRSGSPRHGKRRTGMGEKPDDKWTVPLCGRCHLTGPDAQHASNEMDWWRARKIDPFVVALALWACSGNDEIASVIIRENRS